MKDILKLSSAMNLVSQMSDYYSKSKGSFWIKELKSGSTYKHIFSMAFFVLKIEFHTTVFVFSISMYNLPDKKIGLMSELLSYSFCHWASLINTE